MDRIKNKKYLLCISVILFAFLLGAGASREQENHTYTVACMGDSITYGLGVDLTRQTDSYPAQLEVLLGGHYKVYNYGKSGRTLMDEADKPYRETGYIEQVKELEPDIIVLMLGTNDSKPHNWDAEAYLQGYLALVGELQADLRDTKIYLGRPPAVFKKEDGTTVFKIDGDVVADEVGSIVEQVAEETGTELIDMYAVTKGHPEYYVDGVHFNKNGNTVLAQAVYQSIYK